MFHHIVNTWAAYIQSHRITAAAAAATTQWYQNTTWKCTFTLCVCGKRIFNWNNLWLCCVCVRSFVQQKQFPGHRTTSLLIMCSNPALISLIYTRVCVCLCCLYTLGKLIWSRLLLYIYVYVQKLSHTSISFEVYNIHYIYIYTWNNNKWFIYDKFNACAALSPS